ncbi:MAG: DNA polymerase, partial [Planctomycetota bacterium]
MIQVAQLEFDCIVPTIMTELAGMLVNWTHYLRLYPVYERKCKRLEARLQEMAGRTEFNPRSPQQVRGHINEVLNLNIKDTSEKTLKKYRDKEPFIATLLDYREAHKLFSTYIKPLPELVYPDGRIHPEFHQVGSEAGRYSCRRPNVQQAPARTHPSRFRRLYKAPDGYMLLASDFGSLEAKVLAEMSQDPGMLK